MAKYLGTGSLIKIPVAGDADVVLLVLNETVGQLQNDLVFLGCIKLHTAKAEVFAPDQGS